MSDKDGDLAKVIAWAEKFIAEHRDAFERMHSYTSEMHRHDKLAKQIRSGLVERKHF